MKKALDSVDLPFAAKPRLTKALKGDIALPNQEAQIYGSQWVRVEPTPVESPKLRAISEPLLRELGLNKEQINSAAMLKFLAGNANGTAQVPFASRYAGHQFGNFAGQLGDGRAITIGETTINNQPYELQLKGAGKTPFSRGADGRAVLRSSIREFLCSEAMFHLGIPTTRALSLVTTGEEVVRDMFYDGNPQIEQGAIVLRVAPSFIRFGHFEMNTYRNERENLKELLDFTIEQYFPEYWSFTPQKRHAAFFHRVCRDTATLVVHWLRVGFVHGVLNSDNMSILSQTIDYGPYGWLDEFDPFFTPNTTDARERRYRFGNQFDVVRFNLVTLANALYPAIEDKNVLEEGISIYDKHFAAEYKKMQGAKFGIEEVGDQDHPLIQQGYQWLYNAKMDFTLFFRKLSTVSKTKQIDTNDFIKLSYNKASFNNYSDEGDDWLKEYQRRINKDVQSDDERRQHMDSVNPAFILRNYISHQAIMKAEEEDFSEVEALLDVLQSPYEYKAIPKSYLKLRPPWANDVPGCSKLSCSS